MSAGAVNDFDCTYNGNSGNPLSISPVCFLPNAGLELILKEPSLRFVVCWRISPSVVASVDVGLPSGD